MSGYDKSYNKTDQHQHRSCIRAFLNPTSSKSKKCYDDRSECHSAYGLLNPAQKSKLDESYYSAKTSRTESTHNHWEPSVEKKGILRGMVCRSTGDKEGGDGEEYTVKVVDEFSTQFGNFDSEFSSEFDSQGKRPDKVFPSAFDDSFDSKVMDEIELRRKNNIFMGCAQLKKRKETRRNRGSEAEGSQSIGSHDRKGQVPMSQKFNASIVNGGNFPQIVFADDGEEKLFRERNEMTESHNIQPFSAYTSHHARSRSPSPSRSRSSRLSRSPNRSPTRHEEQLLDSLARPQNYKNYDILKHAIAELTGREKELLNQQLKEIPEFIGVGAYKDCSDLVSEFDGKSVNERIKMKKKMKSKPDSNSNFNYVNEIDEEVSITDGRANFHESGIGVVSKLRNVDERSKKWRLREKDAGGFVNSTSSQGKPPLPNVSNELHRRKLFTPNQNNRIARDIPGSPESTHSRRKLLPSPLPTASLLDADTTASESFMVIDEGNESVAQESSLLFGGKEYRRSPLALAEGFEDFGIDDRIYPRQQASDTFDYDEGQDEDFASCQSGSRSSSNGRARYSNLMQTYITNQERFGHSSKSVTSDVSTAVSSSSRSLRSSKYQEIAGSAYKVSITVNENSPMSDNLVDPTLNELDTKSSLSGQTYQFSNTTKNVKGRQKASKSPQSVVDQRNW